MYTPEIVAPMKEDLTGAGFEQLVTSNEVDTALNGNDDSVLVVVNSVCGCAAANARPGVKMSLDNGKKPSKLTTVFAGVDKDAVDQARKYMLPYPPSSPSIALFKSGKLVHVIERHHIEGRAAEMIADNLKMAYDEHC